MAFIDKLKDKLVEVYEPDIEGGDDLTTEFAKHVISKYLGMAVEEGVKELIRSGDIPEDAGPMVQELVDQIVPKLDKYVSSGRLPIA